jgi:pilus assembly protein CpaB
MNRSALIPLIAGLGIGGLALKLGFDFVKRAKGAQGANTQVWVAHQDIPRWVAIDETMLKGAVFPANAVPPGAFAEQEKLVGRVLRMAAPGGLPILESMLLPPGAKPGLVVPEGYRAVGVKIDEGSGVDYHLQPGCRVDVIGYFSVRGGGVTRTIARIILENVEVGAVGPQLSAVSPTAEEQSGKKDSHRQKKVRAVTLFVKPNEVPQLHMAEQRGKIKLAMRNADDAGSSGEAPWLTAEEFLGDDQPAEPDDDGPVGLASDLISKLAHSQAPPPPPPQAPAKPALAWVMRIWNGNQMHKLGWHGLDSIDVIDLTVAAQSEVEKEGPLSARSPAAQTDRATQANEEPALSGDGTEEPKDPEPEELNE